MEDTAVGTSEILTPAVTELVEIPNESITAGRKVNPIWKHFTNTEDPKKVACAHCKANVSRGGVGQSANTTNMVYHLKLHHKQQHESYLQDKNAPTGKDTGSGLRQMTIEAAFAPEKKWKITDPKAVKLHTALGEMIAVDNLPFSYVENEGFRRFMGLAQPHYEVPGRTFFSTKIIPGIYEKCVAKVRKLMADTVHTSFTTDIWTADNANESFISLTAHWISESFNNNHIVLNSSWFPGSHTGENIAQKLTTHLNDWDVKTKVHLIIRDNAANMIKGLNDAQLPNESCALHTLQLSITDSIKCQRSVNDMVAVARGIAGRFNHSPLACHRLKEIQDELKMANNKVKQDVVTRWNSTYYMLRRLLEQRNSVTLYCSQSDLVNLTENQWNLLKSMLSLLQPFEEITKIMSGTKSTISEVVPHISILLRYLEKENENHIGVKTMRDELRASLRTRFDATFSNDNYTKATILDPRFKLHFFKKEQEEELMESLIVEIVALKKMTMVTTGTSDQATTSAPTPAKQLRQGTHTELWKCFSEIVSERGQPIPEPTEEMQIVTAVRSETTIYVQGPIADRQSCPFEWWKLNRERFPSLALLARKYLSAPGSTIFSEGLFSTEGRIYEDRRNRLAPKNGEMLTFLNRNLKLLNFDYEA